MLPVLGAISCAFLVGPSTDREPAQYTIASVLIGIGIALWFVTVWLNHTMRQTRAAPDPKGVGGRGSSD
jgi:basic amino acid/polyamine antiporter, APA family